MNMNATTTRAAEHPAPGRKVTTSSVTPADAYVGRRVRERRLTLGLSQNQLGVRLGVTTQQTHKYETGQNRMTVGQLFAVSQALDVSTGWFFDGLGGSPEPEGDAKPYRLMLEMARSFAAIEDQKLQEALSTMARAMASQAKA